VFRLVWQSGEAERFLLTLTMRGVFYDVINDSDVTERGVHVVGGRKTGRVGAVKDDQLQVVASCSEQPILPAQI